MKNINKTKGMLTLISVILIILISYSLVNVNENGRKIKIGIIAPLTGGASVFGNSMVKGVEMAFDDLPADLKDKYQIIVEDDATNPAKAASAANKLISIDRVDVVLTVTAGTGSAVSPIADKNKVVHICVACADKKIAFGKYNFINSVLPEDEAKVWIAQAKKQNVSNIGLITMNHPGVNAIAAEIKNEAVKNNISVDANSEYKFNSDEKDFKTIILKAKDNKVDLFYFQSLPPALDILGKEMNNFNLKNVAGGAGTFTIGADLSMFDGKWYTEAIIKDDKFKERFTNKYPNIRFNIRTAPFGYDVLNIVVAGTQDKMGLLGYINNLGNYDGVVGNMSKDANNNYIKAIPGIWKIENGRTVFVE